MRLRYVLEHTYYACAEIMYKCSDSGLNYVLPCPTTSLIESVSNWYLQ